MLARKWGEGMNPVSNNLLCFFLFFNKNEFARITIPKNSHFVNNTSILHTSSCGRGASVTGRRTVLLQKSRLVLLPRLAPPICNSQAIIAKTSCSRAGSLVAFIEIYGVDLWMFSHRTLGRLALVRDAMDDGRPGVVVLNGTWTRRRVEFAGRVGVFGSVEVRER